MSTRILEGREARLKALECIENDLAKTYPRMHPAQRTILAKKLTKKVMSQFKSQKMFVTTQPASRWQQFKLEHMPQWFIRKFPAQYVEV